MTQPTSHKTSLNQKQIHLLKLTYKFRFVSTRQLAEYKKVRKSAIDKSLIVLLDRGFLNRHYDKSYKLQGKSAAYYLAPKGLKYLRVEHDFNENALHAMYKNKTASDVFIEHNLNVLDIYLALHEKYPDVFTVFSKTELYSYDHFPQPRPDLYLNRNEGLSGFADDYFLEAFTEQMPFFAIKKRLAVLFEHYEAGDWEAEEESTHPTLLIVCRDAKLEAKLRAHAAHVLEEEDVEDLYIFTTTQEALKADDKQVWRNALNDTKYLTLS